MAAVRIKSVDEHPVPGNLKAHLKGNDLLLPKEVADAFRKDGVRTAEDLIAYILAFPASVAEMLHWSMRDVDSAAIKLRKELKGRVPESYLQNPSLGAMNPDDLP